MTTAAMEGQTAAVALSAPSFTIPQRLNYAAGEGSTRRKSAQIKSGGEDSILTPSRRAQLVANSRDLSRNFEIPGWAARRHLDYVCDFEFSATHNDKGFERALERFVEQWSTEENFEASGRFSREQFCRMVESAAVFDGDILTVRLDSGHVQAVEGDRIRNEGNADVVPDGPNQWVQGIKTNAAGRPLAYKVHRRTNASGFQFERDVKPENARLYGYFPRFDCVRGVSPLAAALNTFRDIYDNKDLALARTKLANLFGFLVTRDAAEAMGPVTEGAERGQYEVDLGKGPFILDMNPGHDAKFLENKTPSVEFQNFMEQMIQVGLKALDIPFSFYNESFTNFFGSRAAWHHYERSCKPKRHRQKSLLNWLTVWRLGLAIDDGDFSLPSGMAFEDITQAFEWIPAGMPWWKPSEEVNGDAAACRAGFTNPQAVCKARGVGDFYDNVDRMSEALKYAKDKGVVLDFSGFAPLIEAPEIEPTPTNAGD
jgi:capsid protein